MSDETLGGPPPEATEDETAAQRKNVVRRLYDWVLHWADTPYGMPALALLAFAESSFFPVPPDVLLMALAVGAPKKAFRFALVCAVASVVGGLFGYAIGAFFWDTWARDFFFAHIPGFTPEVFALVQGKFEQYGVLIVFTAAFSPIPYKVFTISAGVFRLALLPFLFASAVGRSARFFLVAGLIYKFGPKIKETIEKYFDLFALLFVALLIGGFAVLKLVH